MDYSWVKLLRQPGHPASGGEMLRQNPLVFTTGGFGTFSGVLMLAASKYGRCEPWVPAAMPSVVKWLEFLPWRMPMNPRCPAKPIMLIAKVLRVWVSACCTYPRRSVLCEILGKKYPEPARRRMVRGHSMVIVENVRVATIRKAKSGRSGPMRPRASNVRGFQL